MVRPEARASTDAFLASDFARRLIGERRLLAARHLDGPPTDLDSCSESAGCGWLEHDRVAVPSFAYEWSAGMLFEAARLTLALAAESVAHGFGLKDATPDNILFQGPDPLFVDLLSFEERHPRDPTWRPYGQFVRTFLLPLLVHREMGLPIADIFFTRRDGLQPEEVYRWCGWSTRLRPPAFGLVTAPTWLASRANRSPTLYAPRREATAEKARFVLLAVLKQLQRTLQRVAPVPRRSTWSTYDEQYDASYLARKTEAVRSWLVRWPRNAVLDLGCNMGHFSALAAELGARVVAIDADPAVIDGAWNRARRHGLAIQPIVANIALPSPATGWRNRERPALLERLAGRFDGVLAIALLHHLLVTERVPLDEIVTLLANVTTDLLVIELVGPADPLFQRLCRGRDELHDRLTPVRFEQHLRAQFEIADSLEIIPGRRWLYAARRRGLGA